MESERECQKRGWTRKRIAFVTLILGATILTAWPLAFREPAHAGRRVSEWWDDYVFGAGTNRIPAQTALRAMGSDAVPFLVKRMQGNDSGWAERYASAQANFPGWLQRFVPRPRPTIKERELAARALGELGSHGRAAVPELLTLIRKRIENADPKKATPVYPEGFVTVVTKGATNQAIVINGALVFSNPPPIFHAVRDPLAENAATSLGWIGADNPAVVPTLLWILEPHPLRHTSARKGAFRALRNPRLVPSASLALPELAAAFRAEKDLRAIIATTLQNLALKGNREVIPLLMELLKDDDPEVRWRSARALCHIQTEPLAVAQALVARLADPEDVVASECVASLKVIVSQHEISVDPVIRFLAEAPVDARPRIIKLLGQFGPRAKVGLPELHDLARSKNPAEALGAATAIRQISGDPLPLIGVYQQRIGKHLQSGKDGSSSAEDRLSDRALYFAAMDIGSLLKSHDVDVRRSAAALLGRIGPKSKRAGPDLNRLLRDPDEGVRLAARAALDQIYGAHCPY